MRAIVSAVVLSLLLAGQALAEAPAAKEIADARAAMMADPAAALALAQAAETRAGADRLAATEAQWLQAEALSRMNRPAEATPIVQAALFTVGTEAPGSKLQADLMMTLARAARPQSDYATALANFQGAHKIFAALGEARSQAMALQEIGSIYTDARDYPRALDYYARAGEAFAGDPKLDLARLNNMANAHRELRQFDEAESGYRQALAIAEAMDSPMLRARILANIAAVQVAEGRFAEADATAAAGLALKAEGWEPFLWGVRAQAAFAQGDVGTAASRIRRTFAGADLAATTAPFRDFHDAAHKIFARQGNQTLALQHLQAFKRLDDEGRNVAASANLALMGAQFDFAAQELKISQLRTQTLEAQARQRTLVFSGVLGIAAILVAAGWISYAAMRKSRDRVRAANAQLNDTNTALEKALKAKSEFLAMTSHEIRTPLNGILGMTQIMLQDRALAPDVREKVEIVFGAGETMRAVVDDILDVAKMETGKISIMPAPFDPRRTLEEVSRIWRENAAAKGLELAVDLAACPVGFTADAQRVRQIVFNLLSNAVKFTERGQVTLSARADAEGLRIEVRDTGIGIPADKMTAIFDPFSQVDAGKSRKYGGTGLGLSICRSLARAMGGEVSVESAVGAGSVFTVRLPGPVTMPSQAPAFEAAAPTILALEANPFHQCLLEAFCAADGRSLAVVETVEAALAALAGPAPQAVVVSAASLPADPGEAMGALMALRAAAPEARLVVQAGPDDPIAAPAAMLCGADAVVEGAFEAEALAAAAMNADQPLAA